MEAALRSLEITVISGEALHVNRSKPVKKKAFVIVQTDANNSKSTKIDVQGGSYPLWNEKFDLLMPMHARFITVEVQRKGSNGNNKVIGRVNIPDTDFIGGWFPDNYLHFLSYRLRDGKGERNGIINLSVRVKSSASGGGYCWPPSNVGGPVVGEQVSNYGVFAGVPNWNR